MPGVTARYFYAGGKKHSLRPERAWWAVNATLAKSKGFAASESQTRVLPGGMILVPRGEVPTRDVETLEQAGALQSVYSSGGTIAIPLPEVRIEFDKRSQHDAALAALERAAFDQKMLSDRDGVIVVSLVSGRGDDALDLANYVYESARPAASAARMVQIVRKPDVSRR